MALLIPVTNDGSSRVTVDLLDDRGAFEFRTYWNYTTSAWYLDITDGAGNVLIRGLALVINVDLLEPYPDVAERLGELRVAGLDGNVNRTVDDLGVNSNLISFTEGEFEQTFPTSDTIPVLIVDAEDVLQ